MENAINCNVPHRYIRETVTGKAEAEPETEENRSLMNRFLLAQRHAFGRAMFMDTAIGATAPISNGSSASYSGVISSASKFSQHMATRLSSTTGKTTIMERFDVCAGERCMAYCGSRCLRVESEMPPSTVSRICL